MITCTDLEEQIKDQIDQTNQSNDEQNDVIIFDNLLLQIANENGLMLKDLKGILYHNKSGYYETSGYISGKRMSLQNLIGTFKKIIKKIFIDIEKSLDYKLTYNEKLKVLHYIEYNMRVNSILI